MLTTELDKEKHDRKGFDCGVEALNNFLRTIASQQHAKDNSKTFVMEVDGEPSKIVGFYTLTVTTIDLSELPLKLRNKHNSNSSAGLIARLAVDGKHQGQGIGELLLLDALKKLLLASDNIGFPFVIVDAKEGNAAFYQKYGFTSYADDGERFFITMDTIRGLDL